MEGNNLGQQPAGWSYRPNGSDGKAATTPGRGKSNDNAAALKSCPLFAGMPATDCATILAAAREKSFRRRETLFLEGDAIRQVLLLTSGSVKMTQLGPNGTEVILRLNGAGEIVGAIGSCPRGSHCASAQALQVCRALVWDAAWFAVLLQRFPIMQGNLLRILGERLRELEQRFREVATERVAARVANQLLRLLPQVGRRVNGTVEIALSREELAQMTGTTLFTISRLLCEWEEHGIVQPRREAVHVCDTQRLQALIDTGLKSRSA
jgi:CRP-like cAMP-binding protein